jgi:hypothetical protein
MPDAGFYLETPAGPIECYLEWDARPKRRSGWPRSCSPTG